MDREKEERLQSQLLEGETVAWYGEPRPGAVFSSRDVLLIPFSLCWCMMALVFSILSLLSGDYIFARIALLFLLFGAFMLFGRFFVLHLRIKTPCTRSPIGAY